MILSPSRCVYVCVHTRAPRANLRANLARLLRTSCVETWLCTIELYVVQLMYTSHVSTRNTKGSDRLALFGQ